MPTVFFPSRRKSPIVNFDEHELATLIYGTFPSAVAEMARDFILELKVSGAQFMQIEDEKLHILANDNVDALQALRNLRQSPPECILALLSAARPSPSIPLNFRQMAPFARQKGFVIADANDEEAHHDDSPTSALDDLGADWDDYETFGLKFDHQPPSIKPTSDITPQSVDEPPASADWNSASEVLPPSDASESPISRHSTSTITCHSTASVISANETSSTARNTSEAASPIRNKILTDGQIIYHRLDVLQPSRGDEHVSDLLNADVVSSSPSLVKPTFNFRDIHNVVSTTRMMSSLAPADGGKDIEERSATHMLVLSDQNNQHYNKPMDRCSKVTSPTNHGSHGSFSETTTLCLGDRGDFSNLRSPTADQDSLQQTSISPQKRISFLNDGDSSYGLDMDKDLDPGVAEEIHPSSIVHRDSNSPNNLLIEDTNLWPGRSYSRNFAPHTVSIAGDLSATNVLGAVSVSSCTHPVSTRSELLVQPPFDAPPLILPITNEPPIIRYADADTPIKRALQCDITTNPTNDDQHTPTHLSLSTSGVWMTSSDDDDYAYLHTSLPLSDPPPSFVSACPPVESSQTLENLANINDQMASLLDEGKSHAFFAGVVNGYLTTLALLPLGQPTNSYLAHPNSRDEAPAECFTDSDQSVISDMSVSSAQSVIIHDEGKLILTPASRPESPSPQTICSLDDLGNLFTARPSRGSSPACHQSSVFLPDDNSGYLETNIDSHINGTPPGSMAENTQTSYQDTCPGLEALDGGAKQARYSQTQLDVGTVPELRLAFNLDVRPKHIETMEAQDSNADPATDRDIQDDVQASSKFEDWKTHPEINELFLPRIPLSPSFSQEMSSSLESLSVDRPAHSLHDTAEAILRLPKPLQFPRRALPATPRTLWPISDDLYGKPRISAVSYGGRRPPIKRRLKTLSSPSLANAQDGKAKNTPCLTYCDAATQTELECQRKLLKIQADDQRRELPISTSTPYLPNAPSPSFLGGIHKVLAGILPSKEAPKPELCSTTNPRLRVHITSRGFLPSSQGPMSALSEVSDV
ncbi:hypothetical protein JR316_0006406 [Psilocybe cubensis]|uniref:Uncharacterized protein n=2 Tax=Psilocybe cubensis TaxID=181762 RepID=A0A8H8CF68_PSICU|nr:hypothetical protein JR316_0006406 [Psilocybe cubensis]KAH9481876.1 hypothetical protein JR316_0006406 [Psilocybe cubensis]